MDLSELIRKYALKNALDFGKASPKSIVGKIIAEYPEAKKDMKNVMQKINETVKEVNSMKNQELEKEIKNYKFVEKKKEEKELSLPNAEKGKVVTRFPPEPSGYLHIGHAKALFLNRTLADAYSGKMILRFDDSNPEKETQEYVDEIKKGMEWLGIKADSESYTSDKISILYEYAEKIINLERAYVCSCSGEDIKKNRAAKKECNCRKNSKQENLKLWNKMLKKEFEKGNAILRLKGDMSSLNTVMRDPTLFRIMDHAHYKQGDKYSVWPSYDFAVSILDSLEGITHVLRTKEYELRRELYFELLEILKLRKPELIEYARLSIKGTPISKRVITELVKEKKVTGWDDPRLATLKSLERRGITPEAIKNFVLSFGLTKAESEPDWEILLVENRKILNSISKHYFFVPNPVELIDKNTKRVFYIPKDDAQKLEIGEVFRLKDLCNIKLLKKGKTMEGESVEEENPKKKIQWVSDEKLDCEVLIPKDLSTLEVVKGYCEKSCKNIKQGETIQFERFGFVKLDKTGDKLVFIYSS